MIQTAVGPIAVFDVTPMTRAGNTNSFESIDRPAAIADDTAWFIAGSGGMSEMRSGHRVTKAWHAIRASSWWLVPRTFIAPLTNASHRKRPPFSLNRWRSPVAATDPAALP